MSTGFERIRQEGRRQTVKVLEPYLDHQWECIMHRAVLAGRAVALSGNPEQPPDAFPCSCGLDDILERMKT